MTLSERRMHAARRTGVAFAAQSDADHWQVGLRFGGGNGAIIAVSSLSVIVNLATLKRRKLETP